ncbi:MAG: hypothetical protein COB85_09245 [Bacteroidetes bacterium]|nr:MAG: hypothetical protein COB85_09245 [Bacteroidota bacterium]
MLKKVNFCISIQNHVLSILKQNGYFSRYTIQPKLLSCYHNSLHAVVASNGTGAREYFGFVLKPSLDGFSF